MPSHDPRVDGLIVESLDAQSELVAAIMPDPAKGVVAAESAGVRIAMFTADTPAAMFAAADLLNAERRYTGDATRDRNRVAILSQHILRARRELTTEAVAEIVTLSTSWWTFLAGAVCRAAERLLAINSRIARASAAIVAYRNAIGGAA